MGHGLGLAPVVERVAGRAPPAGTGARRAAASRRRSRPRAGPGCPRSPASPCGSARSRGSRVRSSGRTRRRPARPRTGARRGGRRRSRAAPRRSSRGPGRRTGAGSGGARRGRAARPSRQRSRGSRSKPPHAVSHSSRDGAGLAQQLGRRRRRRSAGSQRLDRDEEAVVGRALEAGEAKTGWWCRGSRLSANMPKTAPSAPPAARPSSKVTGMYGRPGEEGLAADHRSGSRSRSPRLEQEAAEARRPSPSTSTIQGSFERRGPSRASMPWTGNGVCASQRL